MSTRVGVGVGVRVPPLVVIEAVVAGAGTGGAVNAGASASQGPADLPADVGGWPLELSLRAALRNLHGVSFSSIYRRAVAPHSVTTITHGNRQVDARPEVPVRPAAEHVHPPNVIGFSARTSANTTQHLIDDKLDRRRRDVFGPPVEKSWGSLWTAARIVC
ncbi:hypothetical protein PLESTB_000077100 [Pleodorina starrii]|uniref:Uncharacterized protein n=1 Tax=Pleodorina starrii TaxID=330485 RepID=A0A9W6B9Z8_9CHLO|nr:hypothetical protein PLESTM_000072900 [Pleodorina starrii]GLC48266.1 hypothetical protein PLESTB_000077100 [Pleodorina starrii]GLC66555.1 hypothetical protein PLESTF_000443300 [Pleodorina starrii]